MPLRDLGIRFCTRKPFVLLSKYVMKTIDNQNLSTK